jgi:hypothetical protein
MVDFIYMLTSIPPLLSGGSGSDGPGRFKIGAKRIDVDSSAAGVAGIDGQLLRAAAAPEIHENPLYAVLVKVLVLSIGNQVPEETGSFQPRAPVTDLNSGPIRLTGDRTICF